MCQDIRNARASHPLAAASTVRRMKASRSQSGPRARGLVKKRPSDKLQLIDLGNRIPPDSGDRGGEQLGQRGRGSARRRPGSVAEKSQPVEPDEDGGAFVSGHAER